MQKKILAAIVIAIIAIAAVAAWQLSAGNNPSPSPSPTTTPSGSATSTPSPEARNIRIGLVAPYKSPIGQDMDRAAKMAVDEINNAGGIYVADWNAYVNITLVIADTQDDSPGNAVTPVTRAVEQDNVDMLIGGYGSAGTLANEIVAIENRVPYIITGASNQLVTRRGPQGNYGGLAVGNEQRVEDAEGMSYIFHYCTTTYHYSKTVVEFFAQAMKPMLDSQYNFSTSRPLKLALLYRDDAFGNGVAQASKFWIQNETLPIEIVADRKYPTATTDFQADLTVIKAANPDAVFVVDNPDRTPTVITQGLTNVGLKTVYIAVENNEEPVFYTLLGENGNGQLLESKFGPYADYLPAISAYVAKYNQTYNKIPGMMGADTYDAFYIAKDAITRAGTVDKSEVRDAIETTNMDQMLILTDSCKIQFSTGVNYHEISPVTFIEQLVWDAAIGECRPVIVWAPGTTNAYLIKGQFAFPVGYQPGSP
jgi:branched-chain amino acid transport system substrate-binding protein